MGQKLSFREMVDKLEQRFGSLELTETARADFLQAVQKPNEQLEDWADRVLTLATTAYKDLPDAHVIKEAVARFCQGCHDKKAAKHACLENPRTLHEAMSAVKQHQYVISTVDADSKPKRKSRDEYPVIHRMMWLRY